MQPHYILIAEDDEDDQFLLSSAFKEIDYNLVLVFVTNGIDLINHFIKIDNGIITTLPSLLIVDLNMPKKNGKEAISELSEKEYFKKFNTIIFSTTSNDIEKIKCKSLGVKDFFVKPSNFRELVDLVVVFKSLAVLH